MSVALASAWRPRGERARFEKFYPELAQAYEALIVAVPPDAQDSEEVRALANLPHVFVARTSDWSHGRHRAIHTTLEKTCATHIHYNDFDRLLHWMETRADEWRAIVQAVQQHDCLILGRTELAYTTHPAALRETEKISNAVISQLLGTPMDFSAGSKGLSRRAAEFLMANSPPGRALGMDAEMPILLQRAGFQIDSIRVDGLDWESADRYRERAADVDTQRRAAEEYDREAQHWAERVRVAQEIIEAGFEAVRKPLVQLSDSSAPIANS